MVATFTATLSEILDCERPEDHDPRLLGLNDYPIWDNDYRQTLNNKIVMRFWNREIGFETVSMFQLHMRRKMGEIMPYYNQLAKSAQLEYDPFETVNVVDMSTLSGHVGMTGHDTTTGETVSDTADKSQTDTETDSTESGTSRSTTDGTESGTSTSTSTTTETGTSSSTGEGTEQSTGSRDTDVTETSGSDTTSNSESVSRNVNSETPQTRLAGYEDYATSASDGKSESQSGSNVDSHGSSDTTEATTTEGSTTSSEQGETARDSETVTAGETTGENHSETTGETTGESHTDYKALYEAEQHARQQMEQEGHQRSDQDTTQETRDARQGSEGVKAELLMAYRATLVNVDVMILNELETLFMGVWDVTDSHTQNENYFGLMGYYYW